MAEAAAEEEAKSCDDILSDILLTLPSAKSITTLKLVSKNWYSLISNPIFISSFITRQIDDNNLCNESNSTFYGYPDKDKDSSTVFVSYRNVKSLSSMLVVSGVSCFKKPGFEFGFLPFDNGSVDVVGSFSDLLLCSVNGNQSWEYYVCNPFTYHWMYVSSLYKKYVDCDRHIGFICEPFYSRTRFSVDYSYRFRVVCFIEVQKNCILVCTYLSEIGKWYESILIGAKYSCKSKVVALNGKLYWHNGADVVSYDPFDYDCRCVFIDGSEFKHGDKLGFGCFYAYCLGACRGVLRIMQLLTHVYGARDDLNIMSVWELEENESRKWNLKHKLCLSAMWSREKSVHEFMSRSMFSTKPLAFSPTDKNIVYLGFDEQVISCNLSTGELKVAGKVTPGSYFYNFDNVFSVMRPLWPTPVPQNAGL